MKITASKADLEKASYASLKLHPTDREGVKCRATSVAEKREKAVKMKIPTPLAVSSS